MTAEKTHEQQIKDELRAAGLSWFELSKFTSHHLPRIIHPNEHVQAAVFGRKKESLGFMGSTEGMLVATDERVIFIDHRPGYTTMDEISYDVISGVNISAAALFASVTLFSKVENYKLTYAKLKCARIFADYIESRTMDMRNAAAIDVDEKKPIEKASSFEVSIDIDALAFLNSHEIGVLSSIERTGSIDGSVVYYTMHNGRPYFMTKTSTRKSNNILGNQHAAFTVFDEGKLQTVQLQGVVEAEQDEKMKMEIATAIIRSRTYNNGSHLPPVIQLEGGEFITFRITPTKYRFTDFKTH